MHIFTICSMPVSKWRILVRMYVNAWWGKCKCYLGFVVALVLYICIFSIAIIIILQSYAYNLTKILVLGQEVYT